MDDKEEEENKRPQNKKSIVTLKESSVWSIKPDIKKKGKEKHTDNKKRETVRENERKEGRNLASFKEFIEENGNIEKNFEEETLPDKIEGTYEYDYNILKIDEIIKKKFKLRKKTQIGYIKSLLDMEKVKASGRQNLIERKTSKKKIEDLENEMRKIESEEELQLYINRSEKYLNEYKKIGPIMKIVSFNSDTKDEKTNVCPEDEEIQNLRQKIIFHYLEVARKYIIIDLIRKFPQGNFCVCGTDLDLYELIEDESGSSICPNCSFERINIVKKPFYSDGSRINNSRNNYEDRVNFEKALYRIQGTQATKPDKCLYEKLDEYFKSKDLPTMKEWHDKPLVKDGMMYIKEGSSKEMMYEALNNIGCSGYYDDINLICSVYFGWSLPDISHLIDDIMKDYDMFKETFGQLPDKEGRKSSLNSQWMAYILLRRRNWPCKMKDFKVPTTPSILEYHKIKTIEVYEILGWEVPF